MDDHPTPRICVMSDLPTNADNERRGRPTPLASPFVDEHGFEHDMLEGPCACGAWHHSDGRVAGRAPRPEGADKCSDNVHVDEWLAMRREAISAQVKEVQERIAAFRARRSEVNALAGALRAWQLRALTRYGLHEGRRLAARHERVIADYIWSDL
jgi:hypothetical protein